MSKKQTSVGVREDLLEESRELRINTSKNFGFKVKSNGRSNLAVKYKGLGVR